MEVLLDAPGGPASPPGELFSRIAKALAERHPGTVVGEEFGPGLSENRVLRALGIETCGLTPFRVNYYDQSGIHGANEQIRVDWFDEGVEVLNRIVTSYVTSNVTSNVTSPAAPRPPRTR